MKSEPMMELLMLALAASCWSGPQQAVAQPQNLMDPAHNPQLLIVSGTQGTPVR